MMDETTTTPDATEDRFAFKCSKGHISWYNRQDACAKYRVVYRGEKGLNTLALPCRSPGCGLVVKVQVNCGGAT